MRVTLALCVRMHGPSKLYFAAFPGSLERGLWRYGQAPDVLSAMPNVQVTAPDAPPK